MEEVLSLKLDADWVLLSACNTAAGTSADAEAASGLGRAFFYAGSHTLLSAGSMMSRREVGGHLACFHKHRDAIEQVASDKHQSGLLEESGAVIVQAGDLRISGS